LEQLIEQYFGLRHWRDQKRERQARHLNRFGASFRR
jgi:hypothetical protein